MPSSGMRFSTMSANLRQLRHSPATWACVAVILGIQAAVALMGGPTERIPYRLFLNLGLSREGILDGKFWQPVSYAFLHGNWWHAGLNALWIVLVGSRIEHMAGVVAMLRCLGLGILGGAAGHLALAPGGADAAILVGMSGGCLAQLLLLTTLSPESRMAPLPVSGRSLGLGILIAALILALVHPEMGIPGLSGIGEMIKKQGNGSWFQMGHACHFGGGLAGWLYGRWLLRPRVTLQQLQRERSQREAKASRRAGV